MKLLLSKTRDLSHDDRPAAGFVTKADGTLNLKAPRKSAQSVVLPEQRITPKPQEASEMRVVSYQTVQYCWPVDAIAELISTFRLLIIVLMFYLFAFIE